MRSSANASGTSTPRSASQNARLAPSQPSRRLTSPTDTAARREGSSNEAAATTRSFSARSDPPVPELVTWGFSELARSASNVRRRGRWRRGRGQPPGGTLAEHLEDRREAGLKAAPGSADIESPDAHPLGADQLDRTGIVALEV